MNFEESKLTPRMGKMKSRWSTSFKACILAILFVWLLTGLMFSMIWKLGGPNWTIDLADLILASLGLMIGVLLSAVAILYPHYIAELRSPQNGPVMRKERIIWMIIGFSLVLIGLLVLLGNVSELILRCPSLGGCN